MTRRYRPAEVFPVAEYLRDELEARQWTAAGFAERMGRPLDEVEALLGGRLPLTAECAADVGGALGTGAQVWMNLDADWRERQAEEGRAGG